MARATRSARSITLRRLYREGLEALLVIVRESVPAPALEQGPYGPFLELIEQNLSDWKRDRTTRGHLVGMGMGSIYDTGGPSKRASVAEREAFDRYYEALTWTHRQTYVCAQRWRAKRETGAPWTRADDRDLVVELTGAGTQLYLAALECRQCDWVTTNQAWVEDAAVQLETTYRLQLLVDLGGPAFARRLSRPLTAKDRAHRQACQGRVSELAVARGLTVRRGAWHGDTCPRCGGPTIGNTLKMARDDLGSSE